MKISIVIPAFNEEKLLPATLRAVGLALPAFAAAGFETEIVVCDNNSTDATARLASEAGARVVFEPFNQIGRARNTGARAATGDWIVFVDADSEPGAELFADVAVAVRSGRCLGGGSTLALTGAYPAAERVVRLWNALSRAMRWPAGSFIFVEAAAFWRVGGFNEELFASEEIDLAGRLKPEARRTGRQVVILHQHPLATSARKLHLYTGWEYFRFLLLTVLTAKRNLRRRDQCPTWYDGRR